MPTDSASAVATSTIFRSRAQWVIRARFLAWFTVLYNLCEGLVSMWFGIEGESVALFGFGADSFIEVGSAVLILWRLQKETHPGNKANASRERRASLGIGLLFLLLALGTAAGSSLQLLSGAHPDTTIPGLLIAFISLSFMFWLWQAKIKAASALGSKALASDASCSLACIKLSVILFIGSIIFYLNPALWWADSVAALLLAGFIGREGWDLVRAVRQGGEPSCCGCGATD